MFDIVLEAKRLLPQIDPAFERGCWLLHNGSPYLTPSFRRLALKDDGAVAWTASVADILAGDSLRYERNPGQRGFCMVFARHPRWLGREAAWTGIVHEAGHYLSDRSPERDMQDEERAVQQWWARGMETPHAEHDQCWARAAMHLAYRAMTLGIPVCTSWLLDSAGLDEVFLTGMRSELVERANEPIEAILGSRRAAGSPQPVATSTGKVRRSGPRTYRSRFGLITVFPNGEVETAASLDGSEPARRYKCFRELQAAAEHADKKLADSQEDPLERLTDALADALAERLSTRSERRPLPMFVDPTHTTAGQLC